ncbi:MAG: hypothetical protein JW841_02995 [Deltaproteobacteria bacterium]|nr:hypothetical protein [Deltaproteobacteria bacterium]
MKRQILNIFNKVGQIMAPIAMSIVIAITCNACGVLSNLDLVFLAAVPKSKDVKVDVPMANTNQANALIGAPADAYKQASENADNINPGVASVLDFVDSFARSYPPTKRTNNSRIWGPIKNIDNKGITVRFKINRSEQADGTMRYTYCLHAGRDEEVTDEQPTCEQTFAGGMYAILYGSYVPTPGSTSARTGVGDFVLDLETSYTIGLGDPADRGVLNISYNIDDSLDTKTIDLEVNKPAIDDHVAIEATYHYDRNENGRVAMYINVKDDFEKTTSAIENLILDTCWYKDGIGRGETTFIGGDFTALGPITAIECWNVAHMRTFYQIELAQWPAGNSQEGDASYCPEIDCP